MKKKKREKAEKEAEEAKKEAEERKKAEILRKQQEEKKWQEDIRTGKVDFNKAKAFFESGTMHMDSEKYNEAIAQFTKAIEFNPRFSEAYCNRGVAYKKNGDFDKAISDYKASLILNEHDADTCVNLGMAYIAKQDFDMAKYTLSSLCSSPDYLRLSKPQQVALYLNLGIAKYNNAIKTNYRDPLYGDTPGSGDSINAAVRDWIEVLNYHDRNNSEAKRLIEMVRQSYDIEDTLRKYLQ